MACQCGYLNVVQELLKAGAFIGEQGRCDFTPLIQASHRGYTDIVHIRSRQGCTALHLAASTGKREVIEVLLANGADPKDPGNTDFTPMDFG